MKGCDVRRPAGIHQELVWLQISEDLEKTGSFMVMIKNQCRVFRCTVNWSRARLTLSHILGSGALESSRI
jgi:hypothetical protein